MSTVIRLVNHTSSNYTGWTRTTCPPLKAKALEWPDGSKLVAGRLVGVDCQVVDVYTSLESGHQKDLDLAGAVEIDFTLSPLPANPIEFFGGQSFLGLVPLEILTTLRQDGAAWMIPMRASMGRMTRGFVWLLWYPGQAWAFGEVLMVASNPAVPDMGESLGEIRLTIGDALVAFPGNGFGPVLSGDDYLADGQGKAKPFRAVWLRHLTSAQQFTSAASATSWGLCAVGMPRLLPWGGPLQPIDFDANAWGSARIGSALRALHSWSPPVCGPAPISGSAGEQEDTLFHPGGEALAPDGEGIGSEVVRYVSALKLFAERPCNHLEADGTWLEGSNHPSLRFWDGRPHWHVGVSPDRLGKPRTLTPEEAHGRWGPDVQHFYCRTLAAAARLTGSYACQQLLRNLATIYLLQRTANPAWSTSQWESAREWGCEGFFVLTCHYDLEDRVMAARVVARWRERVERVLLPRMAGKDLLVVWENDPRVNPTGQGAQWWQESFASWSIDRACELAGLPEGRDLALRIARRVLATAWSWVESSGLDEAAEPSFADPELQAIHEAYENEEAAEDAVAPHWRAQPQGPIDGSANEQNPSSDSFNAYGMPLCVATVLQHDPADSKALAIWDQLMNTGGERARRWMPSRAGG